MPKPHTVCSKGKKTNSFVMPLKLKDILENPADVRN